MNLQTLELSYFWTFVILNFHSFEFWYFWTFNVWTFYKLTCGRLNSLTYQLQNIWTLTKLNSNTVELLVNCTHKSGFFYCWILLFRSQNLFTGTTGKDFYQSTRSPAESGTALAKIATLFLLTIVFQKFQPKSCNYCQWIS